MALKWMDGAEIWGYTNYYLAAYASAGGLTIQTPGRISPGQRYVSLSAGSGHLTTPSLGQQNTWVVGVGLRMSNDADFELRFLDDDTEQCRLEAVQNGSNFDLRLVRGSTTIFTSSTSFQANIWHYFELKVTVRTGTNGSYELRRNETLVDSGSSVNLAESGSDGCDAVSLGHHSAGSVFVDDLYVLDSTGTSNNDFLGDSLCVAILPDGDGATTNWTTSTGVTHYTLVDDSSTLPPDNNDYVYSDTNGQIDLFSFDDLPATGLGSIRAVKLSNLSRMAAVGSRTCRAKFRSSGGTVANGDDFVVDGESALDRPVIFDENPVTTSAWTASDINGGQFGVEVVS